MYTSSNVVNFTNYLKFKTIAFKSKPSNVLTLEEVKEDIDVAMAWSGGKDSAFALHKAIEHPSIHVKSLFTIFSPSAQRVSISGIRPELLRKQAESMGIELKEFDVVEEGNMDGYYATIEKIGRHYKERGIDTIVYGEILDKDFAIFEKTEHFITQRTSLLEKLGIKQVFPLIGEAKEIQEEVVEQGFLSIIVYASKKISNLLGRVFDKALYSKIPDHVKEVDDYYSGPHDEFASIAHTFAFAGPVFKEPITFETGETRESQWGDYLDITVSDENTLEAA